MMAVMITSSPPVKVMLDFQQCTCPSKKYTIPKTTRKPRQPPPHFQPAYPAINVLSQLFIFYFFLSIQENCAMIFLLHIWRLGHSHCLLENYSCRWVILQRKWYAF